MSNDYYIPNKYCRYILNHSEIASGKSKQVRFCNKPSIDGMTCRDHEGLVEHQAMELNRR